MHTKYTRCIRDGGPRRFEVWPVVGCIHRLVYSDGSYRVFHASDIVTPRGIEIQEGGFLVKPHNESTVRYISAREAQRYVSPTKR